MNSPVATEARLLLVDGHAYAYRSFHAIRSLSSPTGQPTNGIFGFIKAITSMMANLAPTHAAVIWDGGLAAERLALLPEYKAQRPPMPPALATQIDGMVLWLTASGITSFRQDGIEADDAIATLALRAANATTQVIIASSDKDFLQLVSPRIGILNPSDKTGRIWSDEDVVAKTGVRPDQIVDWLCLVGDTVDNIPGIAGVGPKTAAILLREFGTCHQLLQRVSEVKSDRMRAALFAGADLLRRNEQMIRLKSDLELPLAPNQAGRRAPDLNRLAALYQEWGFRSLRAAIAPVDIRQPTLGI